MNEDRAFRANILCAILADIGGRLAVASAERAIEIRDVVEPGLEGDRRDVLAGANRDNQGRMSALQPLEQQVIGEAGALLAEQLAHIIRRNLLRSCQRFRRQIALSEAGLDLEFGDPQARRADASRNRSFGLALMLTGEKDNQVAQIRGDLTLEFVVGAWIEIKRRFRIGDDEL